MTRTTQRRPGTGTRVILALLTRAVIVLSIPILLSEYLQRDSGKEYGVGLWKKLKLAFQMARNRNKVITASHYLEHLLIATQIMRVPKDVEGCVVECGSFKGGSATNLSLVCALCGRHLEIFDSFKGLPEPSESDRAHVLVSVNQIHTYEKGAWQGTLDEVQGNISRYGNIGVCGFNVGYFNETLPSFRKKCVLAFLDVDLTDSLTTCLKYLWPLLQDGSYLFTHEAPHKEISAAFFDQAWWHANTDSDAPGLVGAGSGLGIFPSNVGFRSDLGFTVKRPRREHFIVNPQTGLRDEESHSQSPSEA